MGSTPSSNWRDLVDYTTIGNASLIDAVPLAQAYMDPSLDTAYGRKTHVGAFRTCWRCTNATWAGTLIFQRTIIRSDRKKARKKKSVLFESWGGRSPNLTDFVVLRIFSIQGRTKPL